MSSYNIFGGTPKKTLDLIKYSNNECYLYVWTKRFQENRSVFEDAGAVVYEGYHGRNIIKHVMQVIKIIDENKLEIIQTQFSFGELLAGIIKILRPEIKVVNTFEGAFSPTGLKALVVNYFYKHFDHFVYISHYVKSEKIKSFPLLKSMPTSIIYNGSDRRKSTSDPCVAVKSIALFDAAELINIKNINILIEATHILINKYNQKDIFLYVAGDGAKRQSLEKNIDKLNLNKNVFLLGYQKNIGELLKTCDIFVHPCYAEGFGIAVAEAMLEGKPIVVSNAGALPELIENRKSGLVVAPFDAAAWAEAINELVTNTSFASEIGENARVKAEEKYSVDVFVENYEHLYRALLGNK